MFIPLCCSYECLLEYFYFRLKKEKKLVPNEIREDSRPMTESQDGPFLEVI